MTEKDARTRLVEAALPLFATKGFAAVTFKEISEASGVNSALINYYFKSKEGLYEAVVEEQFQKFQTLFLEPDWFEVEPVDRISQFLINFTRLHRKNPYIRRLLTSELNHPSPFVEKFVQKYLRKFSDFIIQTIEEGMAKGQFRNDLNPTYTAAILVGMVNYYFVAEQLAAKFLEKVSFEDDKDSFGLQAVTVCLEGILSPGYQKPPQD